MGLGLLTRPDILSKEDKAVTRTLGKKHLTNEEVSSSQIIGFVILK